MLEGHSAQPLTRMAKKWVEQSLLTTDQDKGKSDALISLHKSVKHTTDVISLRRNVSFAQTRSYCMMPFGPTFALKAYADNKAMPTAEADTEFKTRSISLFTFVCVPLRL